MGKGTRRTPQRRDKKASVYAADKDRFQVGDRVRDPETGTVGVVTSRESVAGEILVLWDNGFGDGEYPSARLAPD